MGIPSSLINIDRSKFSRFPFLQRIEKPWGHEIIFTPPEVSYTGKILYIKAKREFSLQAHDQKEESWYLLSGKVTMFQEDKNGDMRESDMQKGVGYTNYIGQKHRLQAIKDSEILEVSTPEKGTTYRLHDDYDRPNETEELRKSPNRGWQE
jgi:mannose-6-phosphate isomerase